MIVLIINGAPRTGKDTFIECLELVTQQKVRPYSSIDWIKEVATFAGWKGRKEEKDRKLLSDLKNALIEYDDLPLKKVCYFIKLTIIQNRTYPIPVKYFCVNIREPTEINKQIAWCKKHNIPCYSIWVRRLSAEIAASETIKNTADSDYANHTYDFIIQNDRDIPVFKKRIKSLIKLIAEREEESIE